MVWQLKEKNLSKQVEHSVDFTDNKMKFDLSISEMNNLNVVAAECKDYIIDLDSMTDCKLPLNSFDKDWNNNLVEHNCYKDYHKWMNMMEKHLSFELHMARDYMKQW